jgi:hypothetical protein
MQSASTLKYRISVKRSVYAAILVFSLYSSVILLLLLTLGISWLTFPVFVLMLIVAVYGARKAYQQSYLIKLSDTGQVEVSENGELITGLVSTSSFYNGIFISLHIALNYNDFTISNHGKKFSVVIYRDAVSESEYRLLARVINFGRD